MESHTVLTARAGICRRSNPARPHPQKKTTGTQRKTLSRHVPTDHTSQADRTGRSDNSAVAVMRVNAAAPTTIEPIAASAICQNSDGMK